MKKRNFFDKVREFFSINDTSADQNVKKSFNNTPIHTKSESRTTTSSTQERPPELNTSNNHSDDVSTKNDLQNRIRWMDQYYLSPNVSREPSRNVPTKEQPRVTSKNITHSESRIDWGSGTSKSSMQDFVGVEDAFDHTPLQPGEEVAFCNVDKVYYHLSTWRFLQSHNQGKCCICLRTNVVKIMTLPGVRSSTTIPVYKTTPKVQVFPGEKVIDLSQVPYNIGRSVIVQDFVHEIYLSQRGTCFIRFERRTHSQPPFAGFKVVIFDEYLSAWTAQGISPYDYEKNNIRVRGIVQRHNKWGIEILVNSPQSIEIVN